MAEEEPEMLEIEPAPEHIEASPAPQPAPTPVTIAAASEPQPQATPQPAHKAPAPAPTAPTASSAALATQEQQVAQKLAADVADLTKQSAAELLPFAAKFGPLAAKWAATLEEYKQTTSHPLYVKAAADLRQLRTAVALEAGKLGVKVESASESSILEAVEAAGQYAVKLAAGAATTAAVAAL